jgi:hypothetical protein
MDRTPAKSSTIRAIGYDASTLTLEIEFADGEVYQYSGVPPREHTDLRTATSVGAYFNLHIRNASYPCRRLS